MIKTPIPADNDNLYIQLGASVRYRRVYIVQSLSQPVNDNLMELLMMLDIARGAATSEVHGDSHTYGVPRSCDCLTSGSAGICNSQWDSTGATSYSLRRRENRALKTLSQRGKDFFDVCTNDHIELLLLKLKG